ncbi:MAG TPA: APC family permease [Roseiflexaceae bacterium]|nr:APC family permease [Roseiflexaceae bacterium]
MIGTLKRFLVGQPIETAAQHNQRLSKRIALAVFSSDALSSVAYASEAILVVLITAGAGALPLVIEISLGIALLLLIVGFSYRQTIYAYPSGGGAYIVARENLGEMPGLVAAASLLIDYVLTVAVSVSAGVFAITSLAATWGYPRLADYRVEIALACIAMITVINLRGVKESGLIFSIPTYVFVVSMIGLLGFGLMRIVLSQATPIEVAAAEMPATTATLGLFLLLQAFSAGCTALTGVEAISNGVPAFQKPESRNAATTLLWMVGILGAMFLGLSVLAHYYGTVPREDVSVVSQIARQVVGTGPAFFIIQVSTALILVLAANTSYADFPRLASLLSRDRFLPRQFASRGDRLVFSNGIVALGVFAALLVIVFNAREQAMLPLYAIGVFISFSLSQYGMVRHWLRLREPGWRSSTIINAIGAVLTAVVFMVIIVTRFAHGAWAVLVLIPLLVLLFRAIHQHYLSVAQQLSLEKSCRVEPVRRNTALVLVSGIHRGVIPALEFAKSLAQDNATALYVNLDDEQAEKVGAKWAQWGSGVPLVILDSPYRSLIRPILRYIDEFDKPYDDDVLSVILPEFIPSKWWHHFLHNQTALALKAALLFRKGVVVISVPYHLADPPAEA